MSTDNRINRLARAEAIPQLSDWHSSGASEDAAPRRARGALKRAQLRAAERYALKYGIGLPAPGNAGARQSMLTMIYLDMKNQKGVAAPSVAGDPRTDAKRGR